MIVEQDNLIEVPGGTIWSQIIFAQDCQTRMPLIVLHGGPGSVHNSLKYALRSLAKYFPIIVYDQLGGGNSKLNNLDKVANSLWQVTRFVEELQCLIDFYKLNSFNLFGTSWGASLALEYYFTRSNNKIKHLILSSPLISTKMWINDIQHLKSKLPDHIQNALNLGELTKQTNTKEYKDAEAFFENKHLLCKDVLNGEQLRVLDEELGKFNLDAYEYMWGINEFYPSGTLMNFDRFNDLKRIQVPVLFTCGEFDEVRAETLELFNNEVPDSQIFVFKNCHHKPAFEKPQEYCRIVKQFLDKQIS